MSHTLTLPEPPLIWRRFYELSRIPRESKKEDRAVEWLIHTGKALGCTVETQPLAGQDRPYFANVLLRKPATPGRESHPTVVLQAHIDMVCEKNEGCAHDFATDPIALRIVGDNMWATDTTLGADNGIGLCAALAALEDPELEHGPLEVLITVDEEAGMTGARKLQPNWLKGEYLFNLDSEEEGFATISCAGALDSTGSLKLHLQQPPAGQICLALKVRGLKGGHSGIEIGKGLGNANKVLAEVLTALSALATLTLAKVKGGNKRNAIPREATAVFFVRPEKQQALLAEVDACASRICSRLQDIDPGLTITLAADEATEVMSSGDAAAILSTLNALPHGVECWSRVVEGQPETSTNLAMCDTRDGLFEVNLLSRSNVEPAKRALADTIAAIFAGHGLTCREGNDYPGWEPAPESELVRLLKLTHQKTFGTGIQIVSIHAGLECGLIGQNYPEMQMISIGPDMWGPHTPEEHVSIPSVANFWKLLRACLAAV